VPVGVGGVSDLPFQGPAINWAMASHSLAALFLSK